MPACQHDDRAFSLKLVSGKTSLVERSAMEPSARGDMCGRFVTGVAVGLAHEQRRQAQAERGVGDAEEERLGPEPVAGGDEPGGERGEGDRAVAGGFVETHGETSLLGPTRSIFMITVVDQVRPWFTPSSTLAKMTQPHVGAHINRSGTGRPMSQPATRTGLRP